MIVERRAAPLGPRIHRHVLEEQVIVPVEQHDEAEADDPAGRPIRAEQCW